MFIFNLLVLLVSNLTLKRHHFWMFVTSSNHQNTNIWLISEIYFSSLFWLLTLANQKPDGEATGGATEGKYHVSKIRKKKLLKRFRGSSLLCLKVSRFRFKQYHFTLLCPLLSSIWFVRCFLKYHTLIFDSVNFETI